MNDKTIEEYLEQYGWAYHKVAEGYWQSGWKEGDKHYALHLQLTDTWFGFFVKPLLSLGVDWGCWPELSKFLLELNHDSRLVKIGIDEFGEVSLNFDIFQMPFSYDHFTEALGIIGYYTETIEEAIRQRLNEIGFYTCPEVTYIA